MSYQRLFVLFALLAPGVPAQWLNYAPPGTPLTRDGKPDLFAPAPRAADGKPDLSGVWHVHPTSVEEMKRLFGDAVGAFNVPGMEIGTQSKYGINILMDFRPDEAPMQPEAVEVLRRRGHADASGSCLPLGIPTAGLLSLPSKIVQSPRMTVIIYEGDSTRQIYTDGRGFPKEIVQPAWLGYSVGKWDRDTLVVETTGFNDRTSLDLMGHPHSEALRIVERYHRRDFGHMDVEMTFDDPKMYTKAFTIQFAQDLWADSDIFEAFCEENEKDRAHLEQK